MADEITLTLEEPYIGSAYSPQVTVEEIEGGHSVTITSDVPGEGIVPQTFDVMDGDASQAIEDAEAAAAAARAAASSASSAATSATNAATAASTAAGQASTAAGAATDAASAATGAAASATAAAADATEAAGLADDATAAATAAASNAGTATREAIAATTGANNAAATANAAAGSATDAASAATTAAGTATDAAASATTAASAAGTAAEAANTAATAANAAAEAATEAAEGITDAWLPRVTVGASDGITGGGPLDTASWTERACPGTDGPARIESIHGRTLVWNQLVGLTDFRTTTSQGVTYTNNGDGSITVNGTSTGVSMITHNYHIESGHVYLYRMSPSGGSTMTYFGDSQLSIGRDIGNGCIGKFTGTSGDKYLRTYVVEGTTVTNLVFRPQLIDLTRMFGAGNEPSTVAEFESMYPDAYYPYDAGSLQPVRMTGVESVGDGWTFQRAIDAGVLRGAGTVYDEQTADERIVRVGERAYQSGDESDPTVTTDGTTTHYALATPTTTPIDPPLNLTYKAAAGGTERILHTDMTAPPTLVVQYGSTADGIRDRALDAIAEHDGPVAQTYHAVGTYLTLDGTLYRVTRAIAAGERITQGTNVVATTVMAELLALTQ